MFYGLPYMVPCFMPMHMWYFWLESHVTQNSFWECSQDWVEGMTSICFCPVPGVITNLGALDTKFSTWNVQDQHNGVNLDCRLTWALAYGHILSGEYCFPVSTLVWNRQLSSQSLKCELLSFSSYCECDWSCFLVDFLSPWAGTALYFHLLYRGNLWMPKL